MSQQPLQLILKTMNERFLLRRISLVSGLILGSLSWTQTVTATGSFVISDPLALPQASAPATLPPAPQAAPTPIVAPKPAVAPPKVQLSAPKVSVPAPPTSPIAQPQPTAQVPTTGKNSYIDTTNYSRTSENSQPPSVVLSERSTGCQAVVQHGQLASGSCGAAKRAAIAQPLPSPPPGASVPVNTVRQTAPVSPRRYSSQTVSAALKPQYRRATVQPSPRPSDGNTALLFPLSMPATISSAFGWRVHPITGTHRMHSGTDLAAPMGTPVLAAYEGEVAVADSLGGYGLTVIVRHEAGTQESRYGHLSEILVRVGDWIEQGTVIGRVGSTGMSTGPHLHFEWRHLTHSGWVAVDAGVHLEYALDNLLDSLEVAQSGE